jgi:hypothetical protein
MAYQLMLKGIVSLSDEGLRRNYLSKIEAHREIVHAWIKDARKRRLSPQRRAAHLAGEANLREPFERLVDTGLRLNELRSSEELHEFLIDEATELSGAERVLLVLESGKAATGGIADASRRGRAGTVARHRASLAEVRRTRAITLTHGPEARASSTSAPHHRAADRAAPVARLPVCLTSTAHSGFRESDRDLLGCSRARPQSRWTRSGRKARAEGRADVGTEVVERQPRTAQRRARDHQFDPARLAAELDFQAIVDLVGDKLREVFDTPDLGIRWYDQRQRRPLSLPRARQAYARFASTTSAGRYGRDDGQDAPGSGPKYLRRL